MKKAVVALIVLLLLSIYACKKDNIITLKVMSYNIHHGEGQDTILDLSRIGQIIKSKSPDICVLQEIDYFCSRSDSVDQTDYLSRETNMKGTFGKFMDFQGGEYGMATLVAKPIISTKVLKLPEGKYEPRSSIIHEIEIAEGCIIALADVHFEWIDGEEGNENRMKQAQALLKYLKTLDRATIIIGDFNCTPDSPPMQYFVEQGFIFMSKGKDNLSFQGNSNVEIDHVIYRGLSDVKFIEKSIQLLDEPIASDHRPLVAELEVIF